MYSFDERRDVVRRSRRKNAMPEVEYVARRSARLHVPNPRPLRDGLIAATALVHGMTVVTRNASDFAPTGVATLDPRAAR